MNEDAREVPANNTYLLQQRIPLEGQHGDLAQDLERFTELYGEEKREEGVRGDPNEMRWNQKRREQASQ